MIRIAKIRQLLFALFPLMLLCGRLPSDPSEDPSNAKAYIINVNDELPAEPFGVTAGDSVLLVMKLYLPVFIDEIAVTLKSDDADTVYRFTDELEADDSLAVLAVRFSDAGITKCITTVHRSNKSAVSDTMIFSVAEPPETSCPQWKESNIAMRTVGGSRAARYIGGNLADENAEGIQMSLDAGEYNGLITLYGDSVIIDEETDTGTYRLTLAAVIGECRKTCILELTVSEPEKEALNSDSVVVAESGTVVILPLENDSLSDDRHIDSVSGGKRGTVEKHGDTIFYTAGDSSSEKDTVCYFVSGIEEAGVVVITIQKPVFVIKNDTVSVVEHGVRSVSVLENDSVSIGELLLSGVRDGIRGRAEIKGETVEFTDTGTGAGNDTLVYFVNGGRDSGRIFISILPIVITAIRDSVEIEEDGGAETVEVLENDTVSGGDKVLTSVDNAKLGEAIISDGKIVYTPRADEFGEDTVVYYVNNAVPCTLFVTIMPVNDAPVAGGDTAVVIPEDVEQSITLGGYDKEGDELKYLIAKQPGHGSVISDSSAEIRYVPEKDFNGSDTFSYSVSDGEAKSAEAFVVITIQPVNDPPAVVLNNGLNVAEGGTVSVTDARFLCSDPDDAADELKVKVSALPVHGLLRRSGEIVSTGEMFRMDNFVSGVFVYSHDASEATVDSIVVAVSDGDTTIDIVIKVTVDPVNDPPEFSKQGEEMKNTGGLGNRYCDTVFITDPEKRYAEMQIAVEPAGLTYRLDPAAGRLVFDWVVDNRRYDVGDSVTVKVKVTDGSENITLSWKIGVGKHVWTKVAEDAESYGVFAAVDSFVIFNAWIDVVNVQITRNDSKTEDGWKLFGEVGRSGPPGSLEVLKIVGEKLYCNSGYVSILNLSNGTMDDSIIGVQNYIERSWISEKGNVFSYESYGSALAYAQNGVLARGKSTTSGRYYIGSQNFLVIDGITHFLNVKRDTINSSKSFTYLERWNDDCWNGSRLMCSIDTIELGMEWGNEIVSDLNNGDTLYVFEQRSKIIGNGKGIRIINARTNMKAESLSGLSGKGAYSLAMLDGKTGFLIDNDGNIYFTKDGFGTINQEIPESGFSAEYVFVSADKKAVFVLSRQDPNHKRGFYRY